MKKLISLVLSLALVLLCVGAAFATEAVTAAPVPTEGSITVNKAAIGETYTLYKVLTASVGAEGEIVYPGPVPTGLGDYFQLNASGNIEKKDGLTDAQLFDGLKTWAATATEVTHKQANSATVLFDDLELGYYVITSTQGGGAVISVDSTTPDAQTYEKNVTIPQPTKTVDDVDYSIGDTITYTVTFPGANYMGSGEDAEIVTSYEIKDTLPAFLSNAHVQSISIATDPATTISGKDFDTNKKFSIDWAEKQDGKWVSLYPNGSVVTITYTATLTSLVHVGGAIGETSSLNINKVTVTPYTTPNDTDTPDPWSESWDDDAEIRTYAAALKKVDDTEDKKPLAGAKFKIAGLTATMGEAGVYTVTKYDPANITLDNSTELTVNDEGMIYIIGLDSGKTLSVTETEAPAGYNKLTAPVSLTTTTYSTETYKLTGYRSYDADGNIIAEGETETSNAVTKNLSDLTANVLEIVNNRGTELPSTGGIGTTLFYIIGGLLVVGAAVVLVARRKAD